MMKPHWSLVAQRTPQPFAEVIAENAEKFRHHHPTAMPRIASRIFDTQSFVLREGIDSK